MVCRPGRRGHGWVCGHSDAFRRRPQCGHPSLAHRPRCGSLGTVGSDKVNRVALEWLASLEAHRLCARQFESAEFPNPWELRQFFRNSAMRFSVFSLLSCPTSVHQSYSESLAGSKRRAPAILKCFHASSIPAHAVATPEPAVR